jgi:excisionase family DNA binding protein
MDNDILNLQQACEFLGVSERTMIKLLREEHIPARKIGREWRFSRKALIEWISTGDSYDYSNQDDMYAVYEDKSGEYKELMDHICEEALKLKEINNIKTIIKGLDSDISIPENAVLRISYKQKRDVEKLEFKIYWPLREEAKITTNR